MTGDLKLPASQIGLFSRLRNWSIKQHNSYLAGNFEYRVTVAFQMHCAKENMPGTGIEPV